MSDKPKPKITRADIVQLRAQLREFEEQKLLCQDREDEGQNPNGEPNPEPNQPSHS